MVSVSTSVALQLVPALQNKETVAEAFERLQGMLQRDEATLLGWPVFWLKSGSRAACSTAEECRYPIEFRPPEEPGGFAAAPRWRGPTWGPNVPTAFETRNVGCLTEVEAEVDENDGTIGLNLSAEFGRLLGFHRWRGNPTPGGIEGIVEQPDFAESKAVTRVQVSPGQPTLLGVFIVPKPAPHAELFIVRARKAAAVAPPIPRHK
jgi:general secretion pathway protein D